MNNRTTIVVLILALSLGGTAFGQDDPDLDRPPKYGLLDPLGGKVVAPDGTPVAGARVALYGYRSHGDGGGFYLEQDAVKTVTTDEHGGFVFESLHGLQFPGGNFMFLLAQADGFGPDGIPSMSWSWTEPVILELAEPADLTLRVSPCRWRTILVSDVSELLRKVSLNSECEARVTGLASGRTWLKPWSQEEGSLGTGYSVDLEPNRQNKIDLELRANSISGVVLLSGRPQAEVMVTAKYIQPGEISVGLGRPTNTRGEFAFYDLDPGRWRVSVDEPIPGAVELDIAVGDDAEFELNLEPAG